VKTTHYAVLAGFCVLVAAVAFLLVHPTIKIDKEVELVTTTTTIPVDDSLPPHSSFAQVKAAILASIDNWYAQNATSYPGISPYAGLDCVLPKRWLPGAQFGCAVFGKNDLTNGTVEVTVQTTNPGQPFSIYSQFSPSS